MAVVCTVICPDGAVVNIHDDEYAGLDPEEMSRRQREIAELAEKILINAEVRKISGDEALTKP